MNLQFFLHLPGFWATSFKNCKLVFQFMQVRALNAGMKIWDDWMARENQACKSSLNESYPSPLEKAWEWASLTINIFEKFILA